MFVWIDQGLEDHSDESDVPVGKWNLKMMFSTHFNFLFNDINVLLSHQEWSWALCLVLLVPLFSLWWLSLLSKISKSLLYIYTVYFLFCKYIFIVEFSRPSSKKRGKKEGKSVEQPLKEQSIEMGGGEAQPATLEVSTIS